MTADAKRAFIMNQADGTVSVINAQTNLLDIVPVGATNPITVGTSPLWADFAPARNEMVVANAGDGVTSGLGQHHQHSALLGNRSSVQSQLRSQQSSRRGRLWHGSRNRPGWHQPTYGRRSAGYDNSRAYVVNGGNPNLPCAAPTTALPLGNCTVSVINLTTNTVTATIPIPLSPITQAPRTLTATPTTSPSPTARPPARSTSPRLSPIS